MLEIIKNKYITNKMIFVILLYEKFNSIKSVETFSIIKTIVFWTFSEK